MAINFALSGDRFAQRASSCAPKAFNVTNYPAAWASTILPVVGHLVLQDTAVNDAVKRCVASDVPYGMVESINSNTGTPVAAFPLSVFKFVKTFSMVLECANSATRGHQIQANGSIGTILIDGVLRDQVKDVASSGVGTIVEIDSGSPPVLIRVEFGS